MDGESEGIYRALLPTKARVEASGPPKPSMLKRLAEQWATTTFASTLPQKVRSTSCNSIV